MMLIFSVVLAILPLLGIVYALVSGSGMTVDTLFLSLILLTISGVFAINILLELKSRGFLSKKADAAPTAKAAAGAGQKT
jgi:uncharacterized membrane protein